MNTSLVNQTLLNRFRVDAFIASGGMGVVYRVWDLKRNVPLAMKVLHADLQEDPSIFRYFQREARALQKLAHPNIVPFYGLYRVEDYSFLLQHFIDGPSLKQVVRQRKGTPLSVGESLTFLKTVSAALGYAHAHGVIHSDVKPGNIMIDQGGSIYLTDFGIARHAESTVTTLGVAGSPAYMAPEQIRGEAVSPATDVYGLGVVLFELLTGRRPFEGKEFRTDSSGATAADRIRHDHQYTRPPNPRSFKSAIPDPLARVVLKAIEKSIGARYASTQQLFLEACNATGRPPESVPDRISSVGFSAPPSTVGQSAPQSVAAPYGPVAPVDKSKAPAARRLSRNALLGLLAAVALILIVSTIFVFRGGGPLGSSSPIGAREGAAPVQETRPPTQVIGSSSIPTPTSLLASFTEVPPTAQSVAPTPAPTRTRTSTPASSYDIAFASNRDGEFAVYLMDPADPQRWIALPRPSGYERVIWPSFCGNDIAIEAHDLNGSLPQWIFLLSTSGIATQWNPQDKPDELGVPRCSPNGDYLGYSAGRGNQWAFTVANLGNGRQVFYDDSNLDRSGYASWFSNSRDMLWMGQTPQDVFITQETVNFQNSNAFRVQPARTVSDKRIREWRHPAVSPDGNSFAFNCLVDDKTHICVASLQGGPARQIHAIQRENLTDFFEQVNPVWSADGSWIYFNSADDGDWDIYRIRPDGSGLENLTVAWQSHEFNPAVRWTSP